MRLPARTARRGVSLMESLLAVTILFVMLAMLTQSSNATKRMVSEVRQRSVGVQLAQTKMNEVLIGALPLSDQEGTFEDDPEWEWEIKASQNDIQGLWNVTVLVRRPDSNGSQVALSQVVLDPSKRGNAVDAVNTLGTSLASSSQSPSSSPSGQPSTTPMQPTTPAAPAGGGAGKPATGGGAGKPATGGGTPPSGGGSKPAGGMTAPPAGGTGKPAGGGTVPAGGTGSKGTGGK